MKKIIIDGKCIRTKEGFHKYVKRVFKFEDYYGANLDALWDMLIERSALDIKIVNSKMLVNRLGDYGLSILNVFNQLNDASENYKVRIY